MFKKLAKLWPQLVVIFLISLQTRWTVAFFWVIIHEAFHLIASYKLKIKKEKFQIYSLGAHLTLKDLDYVTPNQDIVLSLSGPASNFLFAVIFFFLSKEFDSEILRLSFESNIALMIFNLLPAYPLDGARILRAFLSKRILYKRACKIVVNYSFGIAAVLLGSFIFLLIFKKVNITLFLASILIFLCTLKEREKIMYIIMGDIVKKRNRFLKQKYIENKSISIHKDLSLLNVIGLIDKNKFNIFLVLDEELTVLGSFYEDDIIYGAKEYGNITVEELMSKEEFEDRFFKE